MKYEQNAVQTYSSTFVKLVLIAEDEGVSSFKLARRQLEQALGNLV